MINPSNGKLFTVESSFTLRENNDPYLWLSKETNGGLSFGDANSRGSHTVGVVLIIVGALWPIVLFVTSITIILLIILAVFIVVCGVLIAIAPCYVFVARLFA